MFSPVSSTIFAFRNVDKTSNGDLGRAPVAAGQITSIFKEIAKYDKAIAIGAKNSMDIARDIIGKDTLKTTGKVLDFFSRNVNPLICVSSGIKVLTADDKDKDKVLLEEGGMLGAMFAAEHTVSKNYDKVVNSETVQKTIQKASESKIFKPVFETIAKHNWGSKVGTIVKGVTFATASIGCSTAGRNIMQSLLKNTDNSGVQYMKA